MKVNLVIIANFYVAIMSFNAIREYKILAKISEFTVLFLESFGVASGETSATLWLHVRIM